MSPRLLTYNYSRTGFYFITICIQHHRSCFGKIIDGSVHLNAIGTLAQTHWQSLPERFPNVCLHEFVIMPNHMHGLLELLDLQNKAPLPEVVRAYKALITYNARRLPDKPWFTWQPSFYDRIVRNEKELDTYKNYILNNPAKWEQDSLYQRY